MSKSKQFPWFTIISSLIVIAAIAVPAYLFYRHWKAGQREDFMWVARGQLELMKGDKSVEFLEVSSISCTDDTLDVIFQSGWPHLNRSLLQKMSMDSPTLLLTYSCVLQPDGIRYASIWTWQTYLFVSLIIFAIQR